MNDLNDGLRREILALRTSTSWRITAPLRQLSTLLRKNKIVGTKVDLTRHQVNAQPLQPRVANPIGSAVEPDVSPTPHEVGGHNEPEGDQVCNAETLSLGEILALDGEDFVRTSFRIAHKRDPFENELKWSLDRLMLGDAKIRLLYQLTQSPEGKAIKANVQGLGRSYLGYRITQIPLFGRWISLFKSFERDDLLSRRVRAIEQRLTLLMQGRGDLPAEPYGLISKLNANSENRLEYRSESTSSDSDKARTVTVYALNSQSDLDRLSKGWPSKGRVNV